MSELPLGSDILSFSSPALIFGGMGVWQGEGRQVRGTGASSQLSGPRPWDFQKSQSHLRFGSGHISSRRSLRVAVDSKSGFECTCEHICVSHSHHEKKKLIKKQKHHHHHLVCDHVRKRVSPLLNLASHFRVGRIVISRLCQQRKL